MIKLKNLIVTKWRPILGVVALFVLVAGVLLFRLTSITPGPSTVEAGYLSQTQDKTLTLKGTVTSPVNLPFNTGLYTLQKAGLNTLTATRGMAALFGMVSVILMYIIMRKWYTARVAVLGTILYAASAWFLHIARLGTPLVLQFGTVALIACGIWLNNKKGKPLVMFSSVIFGMSLLYVPGMIWFIAVGLVWQRHRIKTQIHELDNKWLAAGTVIMLIILAPLVAGAIKDFGALRTLAGIPQELPTVLQFIKNLAHIPNQLFFNGPDTPVLWLGRLPLLDFFTAAMALTGFYAMVKANVDRTAVFAVGLVLGSLLIALGEVNIAVLLPAIYLVATCGIALMIQQWQTVFPRNPLARALGFSVISLAIAMSTFYNLQHYFIAWPNAPETKAVFVEKV